MDLTRYECEESINQIEYSYWTLDRSLNAKKNVSKAIVKLRKLIHEHFENPPLEFEELKEGMWIWDNNWNQYFEICEIYPKTKEFDVLIHQNRINRLRYEPMKFEENRFYRKQVEE